MLNSEWLHTATHQGYMDGLQNKDPDPTLESDDNYANAWIIGQQDREAGVNPAQYAPLPAGLKRGTVVRIPKGVKVQNLHLGVKAAGRTYKVTLHDAYPVVPAHFDWTHEFQRPKPAQVMWPGTGGYWSYANAVEVEVC